MSSGVVLAETSKSTRQSRAAGSMTRRSHPSSESAKRFTIASNSPAISRSASQISGDLACKPQEARRRVELRFRRCRRRSSGKHPKGMLEVERPHRILEFAECRFSEMLAQDGRVLLEIVDSGSVAMAQQPGELVAETAAGFDGDSPGGRCTGKTLKDSPKELRCRLESIDRGRELTLAMAGVFQ